MQDFLKEKTKEIVIGLIAVLGVVNALFGTSFGLDEAAFNAGLFGLISAVAAFFPKKSA